MWKGDFYQSFDSIILVLSNSPVLSVDNRQLISKLIFPVKSRAFRYSANYNFSLIIISENRSRRLKREINVKIS